MNSKTLRRLAADHAVLYNDGLPPNYLFPAGASDGALGDDLTQLNVLLSGPVGTPYSRGVWKLHLKIPEDYPRNPPKASFRTRIWHPNVEESTGAVCVDTLKRDWTEKVTLRDVLVTISCLLIHPNPDSALNSSAGSLLQDDFEEFAKQAKLMTSIHAPVTKDLKEAVALAKRRGEDPSMPHHDDEIDERPVAKKTSSTPAVVMKKRPQIDRSKITENERTVSAPLPSTTTRSIDVQVANNPRYQSPDDGDDTPTKENDSSLSPSPVKPQPESPKREILGKRPLSDLPTPTESEAEQWTLIQDDDEDISDNQKNIGKGSPQSDRGAPLRKSPKLSERLKGVNASGRIRIEEGYDSGLITPYVDEDEAGRNDKISAIPMPPTEEKENPAGRSFTAADKENPLREKKSAFPPSLALQKPTASRTSSVASVSSTGSGKNKPRVGLRRL